MAILFSQSDGSDQHYDTYEEFEQAFILMKRLNGEEVPQDLLDEAKAKNSRSEPAQFEINGQVFEDLISSAAEPLGKDANGEDLYEGDYVTGLEDNRYSNTDDTVVMEIVGVGESPFSEDVNIQVKIVGDWGRYNVISTEFIKLSDNLDEAKERFDELNGVELEDSTTEFRSGDIVRATEDVVGFSGNYIACNAGELLEVQTGGSGAMCLVKDSWKNAYVSENLANIELVCRKEDRKDIEL